jgi:aryl-alcohol dehydrogenase-like predicted oxidoreductase
MTSVIIGATTMDQLATNIAAAGVALPEPVLEEIEAVHTEIPNPCP